MRLFFGENLCQFNTTVSLTQNSTNGGSSSTYNVSIVADGLAEIDSAGNVVRYSNLSENQANTHFSNNSGGQLILGFGATANVTHAAGIWTPGSFLMGGVIQDGPTVGFVTVRLVFHLQFSPANVSALKFDVDVSGWPWADPTDHLGLLIGALAEPGAHLVWEPGSQNLTEEMNSGGGPVVGLQLGPRASAFGFGGEESMVNVSSDAECYSVGTPARGADLLINFTGGSENYTSLHYDPWIIFSALTTSPGETAILDLTAVAAIVVGSAIAVFLGVVALRARRNPQLEPGNP
jgi:hypothetical protein